MGRSRNREPAGPGRGRGAPKECPDLLRHGVTRDIRLLRLESNTDGGDWMEKAKFMLGLKRTK